MTQQLPFLACPGGQNLPPAESCRPAGSMTTEPDGVYTAQPAKEVDARTSSAISVLMGWAVLMAAVKFIWVWRVPLR